MGMYGKEKNIVLRDNGSRSLSANIHGVSRVKQSMKKASDINNIVKRYDPRQLQSMITHPDEAYQDFSNITDLHTAIATVKRTQEAFAALDSKVRKAFHNDPQNLIDTIEESKSNPQAIDFLVELGLLPSNTLETTPQSTEEKTVETTETKKVEE
ncbi:internal scaffolding protein [Microviridae sp.]|nr:internal scaffolding protein [Microviridae sp.]